MILSSPQIVSLGEPRPMVVRADNASMDRTAGPESGRRRCYRETLLLEFELSENSTLCFRATSYSIHLSTAIISLLG